jgi:hypothetical protein
MPRRVRGGGSRTWWTVAAIVAALLLAFWLFRARRVETPAPPEISTGEPALKAPADGRDEHGHDEIAPEEKADLERIIRERGAASPAK